MNIPGEEWIKTLEDGRKVKFIYQELEDAALITAQLAGNEVVYSVLNWPKQETCLVAEDVESHFKGELSKK